jgi:hypothetical protein
MPNLLPYLLKLDPAKPTYMGSSRGVWEGYAYYFQGMLYGFNWGVVSRSLGRPCKMAANSVPD